MTNQLLPARPNLDQLKRQAKDLHHSAREKDLAALQRFRALPALAAKTDAEITALHFALHDAQSVIAREYGFPSWKALRDRVEELTLKFDEAAADFTRAVVDRRIERAERLLALHPRFVTENFHAALVVGDVTVIRAHLDRNPALATAKSGPLDWEPILYVAHSRWAEKNSGGLVAVARLLLERGASPNTSYPWRGDPKAMLPALWAAACHARHHALARVLLEAGAKPDDGESVCHAAENGDLDMLDLLAAHGAQADGGAGAEPWGNTPLYFILGHYTGHVHDAGVRRGAAWLLAHGANPNHVCHPDKSGETPLHLAARHWDAAMITLLLAHGANVHARCTAGRTPLTLALLNGRTSAADALRAAGAVDELTPEERFLAACFRGDRAKALQLRTPAYVTAHADKLGEAVSHDTTAALETMLACGFDPAATGCMGETALHWAAFTGNPAATRVLIAHGAPVDVRDREHDAEPLGWCDYAASSGQGRANADFPGVARALFEAGAPLPSADDLENFGSEDVKAVAAEFMRSAGTQTPQTKNSD